MAPFTAITFPTSAPISLVFCVSPSLFRGRIKSSGNRALFERKQKHINIQVLLDLCMWVMLCDMANHLLKLEKKKKKKELMLLMGYIAILNNTMHYQKMNKKVWDAYKPKKHFYFYFYFSCILFTPERKIIGMCVAINKKLEMLQECGYVFHRKWQL